jgi:branched-chain amino acid transport system substrate-binding protein
VIQIGGKAIEGSYFSDHYFVGDTRPVVQKFVAEYVKRHGKNPEATAALGYDALLHLRRCREARQLARQAGVRDQIAATKTTTASPARSRWAPIAIRSSPWR